MPSTASRLTQTQKFLSTTMKCDLEKLELITIDRNKHGKRFKLSKVPGDENCGLYSILKPLGSNTSSTGLITEAMLNNI